MASNAQNPQTSSPSNPQEPGLIQSHAQYAKGVAEGVVGRVTGSEEWKNSAVHDKDEACEAMRIAASHRDPSTQGYGRAEEIAGKAVGCAGMQKEGSISTRKED